MAGSLDTLTTAGGPTAPPSYPPLEEVLANDATEHLLEVHRCLRSQLSNCIWLLLSIVFVVIINVIAANHPELALLKIVPVRFFSLLPALLLLELFRKHHDDLYIFERHRIEVRDGRLSFSFQSPNIRYSDIRAIQVRQDLAGRLLDYGDVELSTAGTDEAEILLRGVANPYALSQLVEDLRAHSLAQESGLHSRSASNHSGND